MKSVRAPATPNAAFDRHMQGRVAGAGQGSGLDGRGSRRRFGRVDAGYQPDVATPLAAVGRGLVAGAAGTGAMTAAQTATMRLRGSEPSTVPAEVGRRIVEGVLRREVPEERIEALNNAMHVLYGTSWGAVYGLVQASRRPRAPRHGLAFGLLVWGASLVELPAMKLAPPVWEYPPKELAGDLGFHVVYGLSVAAAYAAIDR